MRRAAKNANVITVALDSLQRLIAFRVVSPSAIPSTFIIQSISDCMSQGVDIQLKIFQTHLSVVTNFPAIHSKLLVNVRAFVLCSLFFSLTDEMALLPRFSLSGYCMNYHRMNFNRSLFQTR